MSGTTVIRDGVQINMLLFVAFGIYVLVRKRVSITSNWQLTGKNAQTFGVALIVAPIALYVFSREVLRDFIPSRMLNHPMGGPLIGIMVLAIALLLLAYALKDETTENPNSVRRFSLNAMRRLKDFVTMSMKYRLTYGLLGAALALATVWGVFRINAKVQRHRQVETTLDLRLIATAMNVYAIENGTYPVSAETDVAAFRTHMTPYLKRVPLQDGWGRSFRYLSSGLSFVAWSNGSDGMPDSTSGGGWRPGPEADMW